MVCNGVVSKAFAMPWPTQTECERGDSNPHARRHQLLRLARLPIPALSRDLDASRMTKGRREGPDGESLAASGIPSEELTCAPRSRRVRAGFNPGDRRAVRVPLPGCRARARHADPLPRDERRREDRREHPHAQRLQKGQKYPTIFEMSGYDGGSADGEDPTGAEGSRALTKQFYDACTLTAVRCVSG
jgi:hypothetical protein